MSFPVIRPRRLRQNAAIRNLVRETRLGLDDLVAPIFVVSEKGRRSEITSLEGQFHFGPDTAAKEAQELANLGINAVLIFGLPDEKDDTGSIASKEHGVVQEAIRAIKEQVPQMLCVADLCFCEYTSHGHCGVIVNGDVDNDLTLVELQKQAVSLAQAGADIIAPSGMMDGMVAAIREALDDEDLERVSIMSYSAKYASAYYGPFREAVASAPSFGDRKTYQMDPANTHEAMREIAYDIEEGADIVMVKPALAYLDVIARAKEAFSVPLAAYNVSGEYAMIKAAAKAGLIDGERIMMETLLSIRRAGADIIISYFSKEAAQILNK